MSSDHKIEIRDALPEDAAKLLCLTIEAYAQYSEVMRTEDWELYKRHMEVTLGKVAQSIATADGSLQQIVAAKDEQVLGAVLLYPPGSDTYRTKDSKVGNYPEVRLLAVPPSSRGLGIGKLLMNECVLRSRAAGATQLGLHTLAPMAAARHIYERMGFVATPELDFQPFEDISAEAFVLRL